MMTALTAIGFENRLVSLNPIGGLGPLLQERGIPAKGLPYRGPAGLLSIPKMAREFRRSESDAVIMTGHNAAAFAALAGLDCKRRILFIHFHHSGVKPRWQWYGIYAAAMRIFPRIAFCADFIREEAEEIYPPLRSISVIVPHSFPLPPRPRAEERVAARRELGIPEHALVVGNAGWLIRRKRWDVFLRAAERVAERCRDVVFLACGDGPLRAELKEQCGAMGLGERVRWLGWRKDLTTFYLALDVLMFNSDWDALPRAPLEAGAYEVPAVASVLHSGLREVITSDDIGFLTDRHDEEWLADKTLLLLGNPTLRREIGAACRHVLAERHDPVRNAREVVKLLGLNEQGRG